MTLVNGRRWEIGMPRRAAREGKGVRRAQDWARTMERRPAAASEKKSGRI